MILWIDAQLSPTLAPWIATNYGIETHAVRELGLHGAKDARIFQAAREAGAVIMTKDGDFLSLLERLGPPPQVIWVTSGNTSNVRMREILGRSLSSALDLLRLGEPLVEISGSR